MKNKVVSGKIRLRISSGNQQVRIKRYKIFFKKLKTRGVILEVATL